MQVRVTKIKRLFGVLNNNRVETMICRKFHFFALKKPWQNEINVYIY